MRQGCKYCQYNQFDGVHQGSNICLRYSDHIDPYSEGRYCDEFKPRKENADEVNS